MKNSLAGALIVAALSCLLLNVSSGFAADSAKGPDILIVDDKVSIQAEAIPLGRLLRLLDEATGMKSKVAPELANRNVSVRFTGLSFDEAIHKIFEGQALDYIVIEKQGIMVTRLSQTTTANRGAAPYAPPPQDGAFVDDNNPPPFAPQQPQIGPNGNNGMPATVQTPFGPMANPRANQPVQQPNGLAPMVTPGQPANPNPFTGNGIFGNSLPGFNTPTNLPTLPTNNPFGAAPGGISPGGVAPTPPRNPNP